MKTNPRAGYTLAEVMVTVAIIGILFVVGPSLLTGMENFFLMTTARNNIQRDARQSLDVMNRFLRQAKASTIVISSPPFGTTGGPYSQIAFQLPDGRTMRFYQYGRNLMQSTTSTNGAITTQTIANDLAYLAFSFPRTDDPTIVSVALTMSSNIQLGQTKVLELTVQKVRIMNS